MNKELFKMMLNQKTTLVDGLRYINPKLKDLSQGSRIAFVRQFRRMSRDELADKLGLSGENKRRTITRYERGDRIPSEERLKELANILNVNINCIRKYDYINQTDIIYTLIWLNELFSRYRIDLDTSSYDLNYIKIKIKEWEQIRLKKESRKYHTKNILNGY